MTKIKQVATDADPQKTREEAMRDQFQNQYRSSSTPQPDREEKEESKLIVTPLVIKNGYADGGKVIGITPTPQDAQEGWEELAHEFWMACRYADSYGEAEEKIVEAIKSHHSHLLSTQLERLGERVRKLKIDQKEIGRLYKQGFGSGAKECEEHNYLLDEVLDLLIQEEKKKV